MTLSNALRGAIGAALVVFASGCALADETDHEEEPAEAAALAASSDEFTAGRVFNRTRIRATFPKEASASYKCRSDIPATPAVFAPPRDVAGTSADEYALYMQPLRDFEYRLSTVTTDYLRTSKNGKLVAACALTWLDAWAEKNFMVTAPKLTPDDGNWWQLQYERAFMGASISMHYAAIASEPGLDATRKARVHTWIKSVAALTSEFSYYREETDGAAGYNNIYGWMGLHMIVSGLVENDATLKNRGIYAFKKTALQIRSDGLLSLELLRASEGKSFWYHNYALRPLYMSAEVMRNNGVRLYDYKASATSGSILVAGKRLIQEYVTNMGTFPDATKQISSSIPSFFLTDNTGQLDWLEIFERRFSSVDRRGGALLVKARTVYLETDVKGGILKSRCGPNGTIAEGVARP